jgi:enamine deaminase RidA (YjgF/YER057c/UK114 family)
MGKTDNGAINLRKKRIISPRVREPDPGLWSNCFVVGEQFILSGMVARDTKGRLVGGGDPLKQSIATFRNMKALVAAAGADMSDVLKITVYLTDIRSRPALIEARRQFFSGDFPCAVLIGNVTLASPELLVEIDAWGIIGAGGKRRARR